MWAWLHGLMGDVTAGELVLVGVLFASIVLFSWAPRIGEAIGAWFDSASEGSVRDDARDQVNSPEPPP